MFAAIVEADKYDAVKAAKLRMYDTKLTKECKSMICWTVCNGAAAEQFTVTHTQFMRQC